MPPTYSAMNGRIASRAALQVVGDEHLDGRRDVEGVKRLPDRAAPSCKSGRSSETCSGENSVGIQPSAISPASAVFFGPIAAR